MPISEQQHNQRHTATHVLMQALIRLYPDAIPGVGPATAEGFYHDFACSHQVSDVDLPAIAAEMKKIIAEDLPITSEHKSITDGIAWLEQKGYRYTKELAEKLKAAGETDISFYSQGEFTNMCRGGHVASTGRVGFVKLLKVAGAYWLGDEKNDMLQRISGVVFDTQKELDDHLKMLAEAKKRDHRKLGPELDLFCFSDLVGPGLPLYTPRGTLLRELLEKFLAELHEPRGYQRVSIPHLAKPELYKTSGHWDKFKDDIFHVFGKENPERALDGRQFVLKPMNCPHHTQIYASRPRSYRDLPLRYMEVTRQYRDEQHGELNGLSRVIAISIDDAHVFCRVDQISAEAEAIFDIVHEFYRVFGMELAPRLSVRDAAHPEKYLGGDALWQQAEGFLEDLLKKKGATYSRGEGEAAFYGPKIDFMAKDALGRQWQLATIQLDFNQPERFALAYTDDQGTSQQPVMLHRAVSGSLDRFLSILIEHYAGIFPLWLAPVQIAILPVSDQFLPQAQALAGRLKAAGLRVEIDASATTVGKKIRNAEQQKVPYALVFGEKEANSGKLAVRKRGNKEIAEQAEADFIAALQKANAERSSELS